MSNESSNQLKATRAEAALSSIGAFTPNDRNAMLQRILRSKRFLRDEDAKLYAYDFQALVDDLQPQLFLDWKNVEDYADKLQDERRYKDAIPQLIDGKTTSSGKVLPSARMRKNADYIEKYLPGLIKLTRLTDNSFETRKRIEKDFRRMARGRPTNAGPPTAPEDNSND
jgi:hypothetical protein